MRRRATTNGGVTLLLGLLACAALVGCGKRNASHPSPATPESGLTLHIGHQRADPLNLLKLRGDLEKRLAAQGVHIEWLSFPAGPQLLEAMNVGSLDFGSTGELPPIFAQAAGSPIVYVANIPLSPRSADNNAILVREDSPIHSVADLRGKKIALQKGSAAHNLTLQVLAKAGLTVRDVQLVYLAPPDARAAFDSGSVDAWTIWDPYLAVAQHTLRTRIVANAAGIVTAGNFYLAPRGFALDHAALLKIVLEEIDKVGVWAGDHPHEAAELLAGDTGVDVAILETIQRRRPTGTRFVGIYPMTAEIVAMQQTVADLFFKAGLLPQQIHIQDALLTPQQYAMLFPAQPSPPKNLNRQDATQSGEKP